MFRQRVGMRCVERHPKCRALLRKMALGSLQSGIKKPLQAFAARLYVPAG